MKSHPYQDDEYDLPRLISFISESCQVMCPNPWDFHIGDLLWQRHLHEDSFSRWFERVQIWENDEDLVIGFAIYYIDGNELCPLIRPDRSDDHGLLDSMLEWARGRAVTLQSDTAEPGPFLVSTLADSKIAAVLQQSGWHQNEDAPLLIMGRSLDCIPDTDLQAGFEIRSVSGPEEYDERVEAHREAFRPSRVTRESYERVRNATGFDPDLDVVVVADDGTIASFCIAWYDANTRTGLFEPVGARESFRGKGLTKAALFEAMHRVRQRGGERMLVPCFSSSAPAVGLYRSAGFEVLEKIVYFGRQA